MKPKMQKPARSKGIEAQTIGFCSIGTAIKVYPDGTIYGQVQPEDVAEIVEEHLEKGNVVKRLALIDLSK